MDQHGLINTLSNLIHNLRIIHPTTTKSTAYITQFADDKNIQHKKTYRQTPQQSSIINQSNRNILTTKKNQTNHIKNRTLELIFKTGKINKEHKLYNQETFDKKLNNVTIQISVLTPQFKT